MNPTQQHALTTKLILDVMGGDHAPHCNLEGAQLALPEIKGELVLICDEATEAMLREESKPGKKYEALGAALLSPQLNKGQENETNSSPEILRNNSARVTIVRSTETIEMAESIRAIRSKPGASINVGCRLASEDWEKSKTVENAPVSAFISAGHSGAMMASALLNMGRLPKVERPAIAVKLATLSPDGCVVLDMGANVDCKPEHLRDFAIMGALFANAERVSSAIPKVGVLSNGEERNKGNTQTLEALQLIDQVPSFKTPLHQPNNAIAEFIGNVEGKELFKGSIDVVVTDGFVGNVVLKSLEGLGSAVVMQLKEEAKENWLTKIGFFLSQQAFRRLKKKLDYAEYGAAPLLGVKGYAFICHGRSNGFAIKNALLRTQTAIQSQFVHQLEKALLETAAQTKINEKTQSQNIDSVQEKIKNANH